MLFGLGDRLKVRPRQGRLRGDAMPFFTVEIEVVDAIAFVLESHSCIPLPPVTVDFHLLDYGELVGAFYHFLRTVLLTG